MIFTIGHSTHPIQEFIAWLKAWNIDQVADIRSFPRSRYNPQYNRETLEKTLAEAGIGYRHMKGLGGLRYAKPDSTNQGWRNLGFRGYADYMQTDEFKRALDELIALASASRIALMCAEAVPWRCHRSLVADTLVARNIRVEHIMSPSSGKVHQLTEFARTEGGNVTYPSSAAQISLLENVK